MVVATHGKMSKGLIETLELIVGRSKNIASVTLLEGERPEDLKKKLQKAIKKEDSGDGVILFLDLFGGTPSNVSCLIARELNIEVVSGVNLPMLLEVIMNRKSKSLKELRNVAINAGKEGIKSINEIVEKVELNIDQ